MDSHVTQHKHTQKSSMEAEEGKSPPSTCPVLHSVIVRLFVAVVIMQRDSLFQIKNYLELKHAKQQKEDLRILNLFGNFQV